LVTYPIAVMVCPLLLFARADPLRWRDRHGERNDDEPAWGRSEAEHLSGRLF